MNRKFLQISISIVLFISIFLSHSFIALADESDIEPYVSTDVSDAYSGRLYGVASEGSIPVRFSVTTSSTSTSSSSITLGFYEATGNPCLCMDVRKDYVYNGFVLMYVDLQRSSTPSGFVFGQAKPGECYVTGSLPAGVSAAVYPSGYADSSDASMGRKYALYLFFNNYRATYTGELRVSYFVSFSANYSYNNSSSLNAVFPYMYSRMFFATDWAGNLTETLVSSSQGEAGLLMDQISQADRIASEDAQRQESIAAAQASQSAQQHEDIKTGYDTADVDAIQASQSAQLDAYQAQQDQAVADAYNQMGAYTDNAFSTAPIASFATSFAFVGTLFNTMWQGFGNFGAILVLMLSIGVAGFILQIKKGG